MASAFSFDDTMLSTFKLNVSDANFEFETGILNPFARLRPDFERCTLNADIRRSEKKIIREANCPCQRISQDCSYPEEQTATECRRRSKPRRERTQGFPEKRRGVVNSQL
jgi:hypothetical protein